MKPKETSARVILGITTFLTLLTQQSKSQEALPPVSYFKLIDAFMLTSTVFVFLALTEFCLVNILLEEFGVEKPGNAGTAAVPKNYKV